MRLFLDSVRHWFAPHSSNNYRARLLHNSSLVLIIGFVVATNAFIRIVETTPLHILGFSSSVTVDQVVSATNQERIAVGLPILTYSETLSDAARRKAANMLEEDYWAHNSPSGKTPWVWFVQAGYNYIHAGENLAKDFGDTDRMIRAWLASPTHRDNILNDKYKQIGVAVVPGTLLGQETVLVVQLFGTPTGHSAGTVTAPSAPTPVEIPQVAAIEEVESVPMVQSDTDYVLPESELVPPTGDSPPIRFGRFNEFFVRKALGITVVILFLFALIMDLLISESSRLSRRVGKNWGHIIVVNVILLLVTIAHAGSII